MAANDELSRLRARNEELQTKAARLRKENDDAIERSHYLKFMIAHNEVNAMENAFAAAKARLETARLRKERVEHAFVEYLVSRVGGETKRAYEECSEDTTAPKKTKRVRASD